MIESGYSPMTKTSNIIRNKLGCFIGQISVTSIILNQTDKRNSGNIDAKITDHQVQFLMQTLDLK